MNLVNSTVIHNGCMNSLIHAIKQNDGVALQTALNNGTIGPNTTYLLDGKSRGLAYMAARFGSIGCVNVFTNNGIALDGEDENGENYLHVAARFKNNAYIRAILLLTGIQPNVDLVSPQTGKTPLMIAAETGAVFAVSALLDYGADPNIPDKLGRLPLHGASEHGRYKCIYRLLEKRPGIKVVDVNAVTEITGQTALHLAVSCNSHSCVSALTQNGANPNILDYSGRAPSQIIPKIPYSTMSMNVTRVCLASLLKAGADPNATLPNSGDSLLHMAAKMGSPKSIEVLLEHKADVHRKNLLGQTPLHLAAACTYASIENRQTCLRLLLKAGADPNAQTLNRDTPLHESLVHLDSWCTDRLFTSGADPFIKNLQGMSPMTMAEAEGKYEHLHGMHSSYM